MVRVLGENGGDYPIVSIETAGRGRLGRWALMTKELATRFSWWATTVVTNTERLQEGIDKAWRIRF